MSTSIPNQWWVFYTLWGWLNNTHVNDNGFRDNKTVWITDSIQWWRCGWTCALHCALGAALWQDSNCGTTYRIVLKGQWEEPHKPGRRETCTWLARYTSTVFSENNQELLTKSFGFHIKKKWRQASISSRHSSFKYAEFNKLALIKAKGQFSQELKNHLNYF